MLSKCVIHEITGSQKVTAYMIISVVWFRLFIIANCTAFRMQGFILHQTDVIDNEQFTWKNFEFAL